MNSKDNLGEKDYVRYDTAHGFPPRNTLHPDGIEDKTEFPGADRADVLTMITGQGSWQPAPD